MTYACTLDLKADTLKDILEIDVISELYFGVTRKIIRQLSLLFDEDSNQVHLMYQYTARLHHYLTSLGMVSFLDDSEPRVKLQCLALLYEERGEEEAISFRGYTYLNNLIQDHPKMALDLLVCLAEECIKAIQLKINPNNTNTDYFIHIARDLYMMVSSAPEVAPLFVNHRSSPHVVVRLLISPRVN